MAHVRRGFFALYESTKLPVAGEAVLRIQKLYDVETQARFLPPLNAWPCAKNTPSRSLTT